MKTRLILTIVVVFFIIVAGRIFLSGDDFNLPSGETTVEEVIVDSDGQIVENNMTEGKTKDSDSSSEQEKGGIFETKEIMITDGVKHSVPLDDIIGGGPPKDGIPSIDDPKFVLVSDANDWLGDKEPGIAFSKDGVNRFYPYQILVWHEIVNDTIGGERVAVTYCPLCLSGFVFDPVVQGERVEFGTSGKLWKSNLVMYDRKTDTLWSQVLGEAILGDQTGAKLKVLPSDQIFYGNWKEKFPSGEVLSRDTGAVRSYGSNPYGDYFSTTNFALLLVDAKDDRLKNDDLVFGVTINGKSKAYWTEAVKVRGEVKDTFEGNNFILRYDPKLDVVRMFKALPDGGEERVNPFSTFWFSWAAVHPQTELYK